MPWPVGCLRLLRRETINPLTIRPETVIRRTNARVRKFSHGQLWRDAGYFLRFFHRLNWQWKNRDKPGQSPVVSIRQFISQYRYHLAVSHDVFDREFGLTFV